MKSLGYWHCVRNALLVGTLWATFSPSLSATEPPAQVDPDHPKRVRRGLELFRASVRQLLSVKCVECHGAKRVEGGFNLATRKGLVAGGESGIVVVPGKPEQSKLLKLITHEAEPHMPLDRDKLSAKQIAAIRDWIANEAPYDKPLVDGAVASATPFKITEEDRHFWSFQRLLRPTVPNVSNGAWPRNAIDRFVLNTFEQHNLEPPDQAGRATLIRRLKLDLLGLPPTPEEVDAFVADDRADAWSRLVEQMLGSPHYGERWARHWLDVARFAESYGFEHDLDSPNAYHYRDFVIRALNDNLPFDQFVQWQLAGDELAPDEALARMATGFLGVGVRNADIAKVRVEQERYDELDDMAATVGSAFLGLSVGCARCHDHKYDPISQENYYRFIATFERTIRGEVELAVWPKQPPTKVLVVGEGITPLPRIYAPPPAFYDKTWFLRRGDARLKDHEVGPAFVEVLTELQLDHQHWMRPIATRSVSEEDDESTVSLADASSSGDDELSETTYRRSALARWITDTERGAGALLARVIVNRLWQHHFGRGIVETPNDFGMRGSRPMHPELLEWLATELIESGWDLKRLHRQMLVSATWQQAPLAKRTDLDDQLFRGYRVRRVEAEAIRDQMLALSGSWDRRMYGPGTLDERQSRRSIYFRVKRSQQIPMMALFDAPDPLQSIGRRAETTVPPQSLALMNARYIQPLAAGFAKRLLSSSESPEQLVDRAYRAALARRPTSAEATAAIAFLERQQREYNTPNNVASEPPLDQLVFWLDATFLSSDSDTISTWPSKSSELRFDAKTSDLPKLQHDATPKGTPAVRFGPTPMILQAASQPSLNFGTGDFTLSILFRIDPAAGDDNHIIGKDTYAGGGSYTGYFMQHTGEQLRFSTRNLVNGQGPVNYLDSPPLLRKGTWHRATGVRAGNQLSLYVDEAETAIATLQEASPTNVDNTVPFKVGDMDENVSAFRGQLAEVLLYRRALTADEVRDTHDYLRARHLGETATTPLERAVTDFCQALFCLNEFIYVE